MHSRPFAVTLACALLACGGPLEPEGTASTAQAIRGGTLDTGDPAVVALAVAGQGYYEQFCTGTLIGAKTVLTAAHCVRAYGSGDFYWVMLGSDVDQPTKLVHVKTQTRNPKYRGDDYDFGILQLDEVAGANPIEINTTPLTLADVGRAIRHVGFGTTNGQSGSGLKREVSFPIREVTTTLIESGATGKQTCGGDSGGPAFMTFPGSVGERVAGVVSFGDQDCLQDGYDGRVDVEAAWIKATMSPWEVPTCLDDGKCLQGCTPVDVDCACVADGQCTSACMRPSKDPDCPANCDADGVCATGACPNFDIDCVAEGQQCSSSEQCRGRACITDAQHSASYCTIGCQSSGGCPQGMICSGGSMCILPQLPERGPTETCVQGADFCISGRTCNGPTGGVSRCVVPCVGTGIDECGGIGTCEQGTAGKGFCRPPASVLSFEPPVIVKAPEELPAAGCSTGFGLQALGLLSVSALLRRRRNPR